MRAARDVRDAQIGIAATRDLAERGVLDSDRRARSLARAFALYISPRIHFNETVTELGLMVDRATASLLRFSSPMTALAFVFPGQGSQLVGMGRSVYES